MKSENLLKLLQIWMGKNLPVEHIFIKDKPNNTGDYLNIYMKRWLMHPVKRKVAKYYLIILRKLFGLKVIGITGSAGKTSTKEMLLSVLLNKGKTKASEKNIDSVYNVPSTILKCTPKTKYLVLEMGVEFPGEMDFYLWMAKPDYSVITNIYPTHTEFFGNEKGVLKEKLKIVSILERDDYAVLNGEDKYLAKVKKNIKAKVTFFGNGSEIFADNIKIDYRGTKYTLHIKRDKISIHLPMIGGQFVRNSVAAATVSHLLGASLQDIKKGLEKFEKPEHRMNVFYNKAGALIVDDSYNNNPVAAIEALKAFEVISKGKKKVIIFGDMLELGDLETRYHKKLGKILAGHKPDLIIGVGQASKYLISEAQKKLDKKRCYWIYNYKKAFSLLKNKINKDTAVLIKGSRSVGLDKIVYNLT